MWTTPFVANPSANKTLALPSDDWTDIAPFDFIKFIGSVPKLKTSVFPSGMENAFKTHPDMTCLLRSCLNMFLFSGLSKLSNVPGGNFSNASLSGAKTVNLSVPSKVSRKSAARRAWTNVERLGVLRADDVIVSKSPEAGGGWLISFESENDEVWSMLFVRSGAGCLNCWKVWNGAPCCCWNALNWACWKSG